MAKYGTGDDPFKEEPLKRMFPKSHHHLTIADDVMKETFREHHIGSNSYGDNDMETCISGDVIREADLEEPDNIMLGHYSLINSLFGQGVRVYHDMGDCPGSRLEELEEVFDEQWIKENTASGNRTKLAYKRDNYPSDVPRMVTNANQAEIDVYYPSSFNDETVDISAPQLIPKVSESEDHEPLKNSSLRHDDLEEYLNYTHKRLIFDLNDAARKIEVPDSEEELNERIVMAADNLDGETALVTQQEDILDITPEYDNVLLQPVEITNEFIRRSGES